MSKRILVVDDEPSIRQLLSKTLSELSHDVICAQDGHEAEARLSGESFDLVIADIHLPGPNGFELLERARNLVPPLPVIMITGRGTIKDAVAALRAGASDFLSKPFHTQAVTESVARCLEPQFEGQPGHPTTSAALLGEHPAIRLVIERIDKIAGSGGNVLIRGAEGTGREVVARLIHASSDRGAGPFVSVNLSAIPPNLAAEELLGTSPPAATDGPTRTGKIHAAQGGTLYLDGIGDMSAPIQRCLLDLLLHGRIKPVGSNRSVAADVRIVAGTHRKIEQMVEEGAFDRELFYRFNIIPIVLPSLAERATDIPILAEHFRRDMNARHTRAVPPFSKDILDRLCAYDWPGNVRQLLSIVEQLVVAVADREATVHDLPKPLRASVLDLANAPLDLPAAGVDLRSFLSQLEERLIGQALERTGGNKNRAAELLGLNRTTLVEKLRRRSVA